VPGSGDQPPGAERTVLVAGRIGRANGLRGEVSVEVRTDDVERRFGDGAVLLTDPDRGPLTVGSSRWHSNRLYVRFEGVDGREAADELRDVELLVDVTDEEGVPDDDAWFVHRLVGCAVVGVDGSELGEVVGVAPAAAQDLLVVRHAGRDVLVPFVSAIVPEVDIAGSRVVVDPPGGLFEP
jgi:16S rRNA processing protein RimM